MYRIDGSIQTKQDWQLERGKTVTKYKKVAFQTRERMVVEIDPEVIRLSKSLAMAKGIPLWMLVEKLMRKALQEEKKGE